MKKFSISTQLLILVFIILLFTSFVFIFSSYFFIRTMAEDQVYNRLESYATMYNADKNEDIDVNRPQKFQDMEISIISTNKNNEIQYNDPQEYLTQEEFNEIISQIREERIKRHQVFQSYTATGIYDAASSEYKLYYVCLVENNFQNFTFIVTNETYVNSFVRSMLFRIFFPFLGIIFLSLLVIYGWSRKVTYRLMLIQNHILDLPKNKYEKSYIDSAEDEIGDLSRSIESMREEIGHNENTKQDMLQNLSHDFKTPIAVIKTYAESYQDGVSGPEALEIIIEQADLLKNKVNRLLQYNSLEYLTKDRPFEEINMTALITEIVNHYKLQTKLEFNLDLEENVIFLGYPENWNTVVSNILDNGTRYAKNEIKIVLRPGRLRIYNDGEHIEEQFLNSVFKPYEKGSKGQFGLGMSIVKKTVDFFGMNMHVQNEDPIGVSFIIEENKH